MLSGAWNYGAQFCLCVRVEVASRTNGKMLAQTAKLEKMNKDMSLVNANLDTTEAIITDTEKGSQLDFFHV